MSDYFLTYVERDLRQLSSIHDIALFEKFIKLCAGRTGQLLDLTSLGNDTGVSRTTINNWLSILQASFIVFLLQPYHTNIGKRLIGNLFENYIVSELVKYRFNKGKSMNLSFYRDSAGNEVDIFYGISDGVIPIEVKSAQTFSDDFLKGFKSLDSAKIKTNYKMLVYNGDAGSEIHGVSICSPISMTSVLDEMQAE